MIGQSRIGDTSSCGSRLRIRRSGALIVMSCALLVLVITVFRATTLERTMATNARISSSPDSGTYAGERLAAVRSSSASGPLRVLSGNPRYFTDGSGRAILLTGSHTWSNLQDNGGSDPPPVFGYTAYLDFLQANNHNFFRLWTWEQSRWTLETADDNYWFNPMPPFERPGPGNALDGKPRFDLTKLNQAYFDRMRSRIIQAGNRGIYVSIMLFDGWSVAKNKGGFSSNNPWKGHPLNSANNINGINGDLNGDNSGEETHELVNSTVTTIQEAYVRKVIDTVNDLDNVLYEISNESHGGSQSWQYHMISFIKNHEASKPKQHPVGMTVEFTGGSNAELFASPADWISPNGGLDDPPPADARKVILSDTDHLCGICGDRVWVWKTFTRGNNPIFMDGYDGAGYGVGGAGFNFNSPTWVSLRRNMGYALTYANRMNLAAMTPRGDLASSGYCLANPAASSAEYLVYIPSGGTVNVNLTASPGSLKVEWLNPSTGTTTSAGAVVGGANRSFTPPFSGDAVLYLSSVPAPTNTPTPTPSPTPTMTPTPSLFLPLITGWNLVAVPLIPTDPAPRAVFASIADSYDALYSYDACDAADPWKTFAPGAPPASNDLTIIQPQRGIWVRATRAITLELSGAVPASVDIPLCAGWNLIGYPVRAPSSLPSALADIDGNYTRVYAHVAADTTDPWKTYDPVAPSFSNDLTTMGPGLGYWLEMRAPGLITLNP